MVAGGKTDTTEDKNASRLAKPSQIESPDGAGAAERLPKAVSGIPLCNTTDTIGFSSRTLSARCHCGERAGSQAKSIDVGNTRKQDERERLAEKEGRGVQVR